MSKGLGKIQLDILWILARAPADRVATVHDLADLIFGVRALTPQSRAHLETVRRALKTLESRPITITNKGKDPVRVTVQLGYAKAIEPGPGEDFHRTRQHLAAWLNFEDHD